MNCERARARVHASTCAACVCDYIFIYARDSITRALDSTLMTLNVIILANIKYITEILRECVCVCVHLCAYVSYVHACTYFPSP